MAGGSRGLPGEALVAFAQLGEVGSDQTVREWFASKDLPKASRGGERLQTH